MEKRCVYDPLTAFMDHYAGESAAQERRALDDDASVEERLRRRIIDGDRIGLDADLDEALGTHPALSIINDILLDGMKTVGELFGAGEMQLPFVLQSAETMKAAVALLEPHLEKSDTTDKGCIVLATVKGDVHDIGKNLVDIILSNNGYRVVNLGIKVPVETMLSAVQEHRADSLGMSGLLVKSTLIMKENLELMKQRGIDIPVILGGAALTRRFVTEDLAKSYDGELRYARDAFDGLKLMEDISGGALPVRPTDNDGTVDDSTATDSPVPAAAASPAADSTQVQDTQVQETTTVEDSDSPAEEAPPARSAVARGVPVPQAPFLGSRTVTDIKLDKVYQYINEVALIRGQWQVRRGTRDEENYEKELQETIYPRLRELKLQLKRENVLRPAVVYGYFPCHSDGDDLVIYRPKGIDEGRIYGVWPETAYATADLEEWQRFSFPRQSGDRYLCIADFFRAVGEGDPDVCAFHIVTMGSYATDYAAMLYSENRYQDYLYVHGLSVESAEALAEYWHKSIREELGIGGKDARHIKRLFSQGYQGSRYSFGYPACPNLEDQRRLFTLLRPERIGITLTEEDQLVPEQSTSAIIVHHPEAKYFTVK